MAIYSFLHKINAKQGTRKIRYKTRMLLFCFFAGMAIVMFAPEITRFLGEAEHIEALAYEENDGTDIKTASDFIPKVADITFGADIGTELSVAKADEKKITVSTVTFIERDYNVTCADADELTMDEPLLTAKDYEDTIIPLSKKEEESKKKETEKKESSDEKVNEVLTQKQNAAMMLDLSDDELTILHRIVEAEATGEDLYGKMLVANVVINRVNHKSFPNDVEGVVFQKGQFSPIRDGRYYSVNVSKTTKEAVSRVLSGEDYSEGALYFFARKLTTEKKAAWFDNSLSKVFKYGTHEFYK